VQGPLPPASVQLTVKRPWRTRRPPDGIASCGVAAGGGVGFGTVGAGQGPVVHGSGGHGTSGIARGGPQHGIVAAGDAEPSGQIAGT
jgi:hypothetical protein